MSLLLMLMAVLTTAVAVVSSVFYVVCCSDLEVESAVVAPDSNVDMSAYSAWRKSLRGLEKTRMLVGLVSLVSFAIAGMGTLILVFHYDAFAGSAGSLLALALSLGASVLTIGGRSVLHNQRVAEIEIDRRYGPALR